MEFQNTNLKVIVANATTDATEVDLKAFLASSDEGEAIVASANGGEINAGTTKFILASKKNGELDQTEVMALDTSKGVKATGWLAATLRSEAVGYNGSAGSIDIINDNLYQINIELLNYGSLSPENRYYKQAHYMSKVSGETEISIASGLALSLVRNFSREQVKRISIETLSADAGAVITGTGDLSVTSGSKFVTAATDVDAVVAVGDYLRLGTSLTDGVYKIVALDTTNEVMTLDRPYNGASSTFAEAGAVFIASAAAAVAAAGVRIDAVELPFQAGKVRFEPVDWRPITLVDFGDTATSLISSGTKGNGDGRRVAELEWFANGNFQELHRMGEPNLYDYRAELKAVASGRYDVLVLDYYHAQTAGTNLVDTTSPRTVMVFCNSGNSHACINGLITDLNKSDLFSIATL